LFIIKKGAGEALNTVQFGVNETLHLSLLINYGCIKAGVYGAGVEVWEELCLTRRRWGSGEVSEELCLTTGRLRRR
jgi:hypothetical protein